MRWMKALGIAAAILIIFIVIASLWHILYLIAIGIVLAALVFVAFKVHEKYKLAQKRHEQTRARKQTERLQREQEREQRRHGREAPRGVEAAPPQAQQIPPAATSHHDIEEELARLKRDMR
jgi:flagellar biosynthesis component FlhA